MKWFDVYIKKNVIFVKDKIFLYCYFGSVRVSKYNLNSKKKNSTLSKNIGVSSTYWSTVVLY